MKHVKIALFSITFVFLPRILEVLHVGKIVAYGAGTLIAIAMYLIPTRDEESLPLRKWVLFAVPFAMLVAIVFGRLLP